MKKNLFRIVLVGMLCCAMVHTAELGAQVRVRKEQVVKNKPASPAKPVKKVDRGVVNGQKCVDLGLSVRWAEYNVGATSATEAGEYFAWGETAPKKEYGWNTYTHWIDSNNDKQPQKKELAVLPSCISGTEADVAQQQWGKGWRMPTKEEMNELLTKCELKWTIQNKVKGLLVTGPNGKSVFLPAVGYRKQAAPYFNNQFGCYLTGDMSEDELNAEQLFFSSGDKKMKSDKRSYGFSVRAVTK